MSEASLGFYHQTSNRLEAADYAIKCIRQFHPDSYETTDLLRQKCLLFDRM